jgi:hypothetical protein
MFEETGNVYIARIGQAIQMIRQCLRLEAMLHFCSITASTTQSAPPLSMTDESSTARLLIWPFLSNL